MNKIVRFFRKSPHEKMAAVIATLKHAAGLGRQLEPDERLINHRWAAPEAIRANSPYYLALRPDSDMNFHLFPELQELGEVWVKKNERRNAGDLPRLYALVLNIRHLLEEEIPGDFAELGVWRGNSAAVLAHYARKSNRTTFLFDTFEGFDQRDLKGLDREHGMEFEDTFLPAVKQVVGEGDVVYIPGYFPESLPPGLTSRQFSLVHLDCDLYEPIKAGMEFFFPRLAPGGIMIVHDYANPHWKGVGKAVNEFLAPRPERPVLIPDRSGTAIIRKSTA